jgi:hypothetical protein
VLVGCEEAGGGITTTKTINNQHHCFLFSHQPEKAETYMKPIARKKQRGMMVIVALSSTS